jgi:phosphotransferase system HPr (HPr) family protein
VISQPEGTGAHHRTARIGDPVGLHLRAASRIVQAAKQFSCDITIAYNGVEANAKSILGLASLVARYQEPVEISACGTDAAQAIVALVQLIEHGLKEEG